MTCVIRSSDPDSKPLLRLTIGIHGCTYGLASSSTLRNPRVGTPDD